MNTSTTTRSEYRSAERSSLSLYLSEIQRYPLLSREEENRLACLARDGDRVALDKLIRSNLRFVVAIAKRYVGNGVALEDLINDGNVGLVRAAERFDANRGFKFISYAVWWIRQSILHSVSENSRLVRLPMNRVALAQKVSRMSRQLEQSLGREARPEEIARALSVNASDVREVITHSRSHLSIDEPINEDMEEATFVDQVVDENGTSPDAELYSNMMGRDVRRALTILKGRERTILHAYFGLDGREPRTLEQIGRELGYTRERIRQIKEQAIEKLRTRSKLSRIDDYLRA